ncbi:MAG: ribosome maturation factor RimM [Pseudomonadota bacterium]
MGALAGAHGVRGDVKVKSFTQTPGDLFDYGPLLGTDGAVLLQPERVRPAKDHFIVTPAAPRTREDWMALKGTRLHVPRAALPEPAADEVYVDALVGLEARGPGGEVLGRVKAVQNFGAGDLLEIAPASGRGSVLVPFTAADVPRFDVAAGVLTVATWDLWSSS